MCSINMLPTIILMLLLLSSVNALNIQESRGDGYIDSTDEVNFEPENFNKFIGLFSYDWASPEEYIKMLSAPHKDANKNQNYERSFNIEFQADPDFLALLSASKLGKQSKQQPLAQPKTATKGQSKGIMSKPLKPQQTSPHAKEKPLRKKLSHRICPACSAGKHGFLYNVKKSFLNMFEGKKKANEPKEKPITDDDWKIDLDKYAYRPLNNFHAPQKLPPNMENEPKQISKGMQNKPSGFNGRKRAGKNSKGLIQRLEEIVAEIVL